MEYLSLLLLFCLRNVGIEINAAAAAVATNAFTMKFGEIKVGVKLKQTRKDEKKIKWRD